MPGETARPLTRVLSPQPLLDENMVLEECARRGIKPLHAYKMWRALLQNGITDVSRVPDLPKALYAMVEEQFVVTSSQVVKREDSTDGSTTKLLVELQDGHRVETVIMRYGCVQMGTFPEEMQKKSVDGKVTFKSNKRATVCLSSQVGCSMGCTFCATGTMNLLANLTAGEILEQLYHANQVTPIRNVVFMGMGEPLDNYDAVISAIKGMTDVRRFTLAPTRISVSTVGVVPRLRRLAYDAPGVSLALSLHAPTQELRCQIVPSSKAWHIDKIIDAMDEFLRVQNDAKASARATVVIEYVLIDGVNSSEEVAQQLGELLANRPALLNVIPYNPTDVPHDYHPPSRETTQAFVRVVREAGVKVIQRQTLGQDIGGACGQLVVRNQGTSCSGSGRSTPSFEGTEKASADIEDLLGAQKRKGKPSGLGATAVTTATAPTVVSGEEEATSVSREEPAPDAETIAADGLNWLGVATVAVLAVGVARMVYRRVTL